MEKTISHKPDRPAHKLIPVKEAKVLEALAGGMDPVAAVRGAGYTLNERNSKALAKHLWELHGKTNATLMEALESVGVTPERVAKKLDSLLDAKTPIIARGKVVGHVEDSSTQLKALDMTIKVAGGYAPTRSENVNLSFEQILLQIEGEDSAE